MCGIVGAIAKNDVVSYLIHGLTALEYRGYDSSGVAVTSTDVSGQCHLVRSKGKLKSLVEKIDKDIVTGNVGIGHTRWATHGEPSEINAHPHQSGDRIYLVHNGIIDNAREIRERLTNAGYEHYSKTDSEVIAHAIHYSITTKGLDLLSAVNDVRQQFESGSSYALAVIDAEFPDNIVVTCDHSPLVFSEGNEAYYIASDPSALPSDCSNFTIFKDGDAACISQQSIMIYDLEGNQICRESTDFDEQRDISTKGNYAHYMLKEIYEQPEAVLRTIQGRITSTALEQDIFCNNENALFKDIKAVQIVACGGSYNAAMLGKYYIESLARVPCNLDIASEYKYRCPAVGEGTLLIIISQSGETADVLAALDLALTLNYMDILGITNVESSTLSRKTSMRFFTRAGKEVGVASTKALMTQFLSILLFSLKLAEVKGTIDRESLSSAIGSIKTLPSLINKTLELTPALQSVAQQMHKSKLTFFLGRGVQYPLAMEAALKFKEIAYIPSEAFAGGELKHGPLALIEDGVPVVVFLPDNSLTSKMLSNVEEVKSRGGYIILFTDDQVVFSSDIVDCSICLPRADELIQPLVYVVAAQLLAYYTGVYLGYEVDTPRNLAKSVTVE